MFAADFAALVLQALFVAFLIDAVIGDPDRLYRHCPHPIVWIGRIIAGIDRLYNRESDNPRRRRVFGLAAIAGLVVGAGAIGFLLQSLLLALPFGVVALAAVMSVFLAQKSLAQHVADVARTLRKGELAAARKSVSRIVGRDPDRLDRHGIARAAIESLAENFADGIVAPVLWTIGFGLPGLLIYKTINTADSMLGHKTDRHRDFGWASARLDDLVNWPAARLTAGLLIAVARIDGREAAALAYRAVRRDAGRHRSPNAGWPEAAMAGALGLALNGPRHYGGIVSGDGWMNEGGREKAEAADIDRALRLYRRANILLGIGLGLIAIGAHRLFPIGDR